MLALYSGQELPIGTAINIVGRTRFRRAECPGTHGASHDPYESSKIPGGLPKLSQSQSRKINTHSPQI